MSQSVILIMVQCYSGGFANFIFKDGNPKRTPPTTQSRFFLQQLMIVLQRAVLRISEKQIIKNTARSSKLLRWIPHR